jgi:hypothetical protein
MGWISQAAPPPPGSVPPNASRVTGIVRNVSVWPPGSLRGTLPPFPPNETFYSVLVEIQTSDPDDAQLANLAQPGGVIEAFSSAMLASDLTGRKITATLRLTGDTRGVRWLISDVRLF